MKLLIIGMLACFVAAAWADDENDMYFASSGDGPSRARDLPLDDEDTDAEASGLMPIDDGPVSTSIWETASPTTLFYSTTLPSINQTAVYEEEGELFISDTTEISVPPLRNVGGGDGVEIEEKNVRDSNIAIEPEERTEEPEPSVGVDIGVKNKISEPEEKPEKDVDDEINDAEQEKDARSNVASASAPTSQFLAAVIIGGCIGLLFAVCVIMLLVYRMRKKDEGSYALEYGPDSKKPQGNYEYSKGVDSKEYFA